MYKLIIIGKLTGKPIREAILSHYDAWREMKKAEKDGYRFRLSRIA